MTNSTCRSTGSDQPGRGYRGPVTRTERESELLSVTLQLLQQHGYDRLTVDEVAATAHASKATVYRRWPTKAELVLAAFVEGVSQDAEPPDTGSLREDLIRIGDTVCAVQAARRHHAGRTRRGLAQPGSQRRHAEPVGGSAPGDDEEGAQAGRRPR